MCNPSKTSSTVGLHPRVAYKAILSEKSGLFSGRPPWKGGEWVPSATCSAPGVNFGGLKTSFFEICGLFCTIRLGSECRSSLFQERRLKVEIKIIDAKIPREEALKFIGQPFEDMVKFVVDVRRSVMALGGSMHADAEAVLLRHGSSQSDLWGGNFFPKNPPEAQIELHSLINIRPADKNRSLVVQDEGLAGRIKGIAAHLLGLPW